MTTLFRAHPVAAPSPDMRPRSKTFEEFEKDTDDAWDEEAGDISHLSSPAAELEFDHSGEIDVKIFGKKSKIIIINITVFNGNLAPQKSRVKGKPRSSSTTAATSTKSEIQRDRSQTDTHSIPPTSQTSILIISLTQYL